MSENLKKTSTTTELAHERNRAAADRTLMAWIRADHAMIGFGFGGGKLYDALEKAKQTGWREFLAALARPKSTCCREAVFYQT